MPMWVVFAVFGGLVLLMAMSVWLFNRWARTQPRHPANRAPMQDDGIPLHLMPHTPIQLGDPASAPATDSFAAGGGDFGGGGADASWSDSGNSSSD